MFQSSFQHLKNVVRHNPPKQLRNHILLRLLWVINNVLSCTFVERVSGRPTVAILFFQYFSAWVKLFKQNSNLRSDRRNRSPLIVKHQGFSCHITSSHNGVNSLKDLMTNSCSLLSKLPVSLTLMSTGQQDCVLLISNKWKRIDTST